VDGANYYQGRIEVYYSGQWGTMCDDLPGGGAEEAIVACRQAGYQ
jgi:hypothetical protein